MRVAKFCTPCSLRIMLAEVFDQTDEQYYNLLNTRELIIVTSMSFLNICLTRLICPTPEPGQDLTDCIWKSANDIETSGFSPYPFR